MKPFSTQSLNNGRELGDNDEIKFGESGGFPEKGAWQDGALETKFFQE